MFSDYLREQEGNADFNLGECVNNELLTIGNDVMRLAQVLLSLTDVQKKIYYDWLADNVLLEKFERGKSVYYEQDENPYYLILELLNLYSLVLVDNYFRNEAMDEEQDEESDWEPNYMESDLPYGDEGYDPYDIMDDCY